MAKGLHHCQLCSCQTQNCSGLLALHLAKEGQNGTHGSLAPWLPPTRACAATYVVERVGQLRQPRERRVPACLTELQGYRGWKNESWNGKGRHSPSFLRLFRQLPSLQIHCRPLKLHRIGDRKGVNSEHTGY